MKKLLSIDSFNADDGYYEDLIGSLTTLFDDDREGYTSMATFSAYTIDHDFEVVAENFNFTAVDIADMSVPWDWEEDNASDDFLQLFSDSYNTNQRKPNLPEFIDSIRCLDSSYLYKWYSKGSVAALTYSVDLRVPEINKTFHLDNLHWFYESRYMYTQEEIDAIYTHVSGVTAESTGVAF
ncbi:MAG: hypothetical protein LKE36_03240 [Bacilli bacterium]|nr:hypothetical protein [Bacilli bacterium]